MLETTRSYFSIVCISLTHSLTHTLSSTAYHLGRGIYDFIPAEALMPHPRTAPLITSLCFDSIGRFIFNKSSRMKQPCVPAGRTDSGSFLDSFEAAASGELEGPFPDESSRRRRLSFVESDGPVVGSLPPRGMARVLYDAPLSVPEPHAGVHVPRIVLRVRRHPQQSSFLHASAEHLQHLWTNHSALCVSPRVRPRIREVDAHLV